MIIEGIKTRRAAVKFEDLPMEEDLVLRYEVHFCLCCLRWTHRIYRFRYFFGLNATCVLLANDLARGWVFWWRADAHDDDHPHAVQKRALALPERQDSLAVSSVSIMLRIDRV